MKVLTCDIGNTNIKTGLFSDDNLVENNIFTGTDLFLKYVKSNPGCPLAVSSVVPEITGKITELLAHNNASEPFIIDRNSKFNLKIDYDSPETLGIDRICSAEGAFSLYKSSEEFKYFNDKTLILSIDFGTATTINIVSYPGNFIGGIIAPGIKLMFESLHSKTAQLPEIAPASYKNFIGTDTSSSIASGVINSATGLILNTLNYLTSGLGAEKLHVFITGGNAPGLIPYLNFRYSHVPELVLIGIKNIYEKN